MAHTHPDDVLLEALIEQLRGVTIASDDRLPRGGALDLVDSHLRQLLAARQALRKLNRYSIDWQYQETLVRAGGDWMCAKSVRRAMLAAGIPELPGGTTCSGVTP